VVHRDQSDGQVIEQINRRQRAEARRGHGDSAAARPTWCSITAAIGISSSHARRQRAAGDCRSRNHFVANDCHSRAAEAFVLNMASVRSSISRSRPTAQSQYADVQSITWDVRIRSSLPQPRRAAFALAPGQPRWQADRQRARGGDDCARNGAPLDPQELQSWADGALARSRLALLRGRIGIPGLSDIKLMDVIAIAGIGKRFNGMALVTACVTASTRKAGD